MIPGVRAQGLAAVWCALSTVWFISSTTADQVPGFLTGSLPVQLDVLLESRNSSGLAWFTRSQVLAVARFSSSKAAGTYTAGTQVSCRLTLQILSQTSTDASNTTTQLNETRSVSSEGQQEQIVSEFSYSLANGTVDLASFKLYNATELLDDTARLRLHTQVAVSLFNFRLANGTQVVPVPNAPSSRNNTNQSLSATYQHYVEHVVTGPSTTQGGPLNTPYTQISSNAYLVPTDESLESSNGSMLYLPSGYKSLKLLNTDGTIAASQTEGVMELYGGEIVGPGKDMLRMRTVITSGNDTLLTLSGRPKRSVESTLSASQLYPSGGFAAFKQRVQQRFDPPAPGTTRGPGSTNVSWNPALALALPSGVNSLSRQVDQDETNYIYNHFLDIDRCVTTENAYIHSNQNLCYSAFGAVEASRETTVDWVQKTRTATLRGYVGLGASAVVFGKRQPVASYNLDVHAGYTKSSTGLTVSAGFRHTLKAFPDTAAELVLLDSEKEWATDFSARCEAIDSTVFQGSGTSLWNTAVSVSPRIDLADLLTSPLPGIMPLDLGFSARIVLQYTIVPCTTADGNYAMAVGISYQSEIKAFGSISLNLFGYAAGGIGIDVTLATHKTATAWAWPVDDILQARNFTPACKYNNDYIGALRVDAYYWWQRMKPLCCGVNFLGIWLTDDVCGCPGTYANRALVGRAPYKCCEGNDDIMWHRDSLVIIDDQPGWQCNEGRYLNLGQRGYRPPAPLCDRSTALTAKQGLISSDKEAQTTTDLRDYMPGTQCTWTLPALQQGSKVTFDVTYVDLEGPFDTLQIYGGDGKLAAAITTPVYNNVSKSGQYTVIQEGSNVVMIKFTADASFRQKGFIMQYVAETPAATSGGTTPYNITFGLQIGGVSTSDVLATASPVRAAIISSLSTTLGVGKSQIRLSSAGANSRRLLVLPDGRQAHQPGHFRFLQQSTRSGTADVTVTVSGVSSEQSQSITSRMQSTDTINSLQDKLLMNGVQAVLRLASTPTISKPTVSNPTISDRTSGASGNVNNNKSVSTTLIGAIVGGVGGGVLCGVAIAFVILRRQRRYIAPSRSEAPTVPRSNNAEDPQQPVQPALDLVQPPTSSSGPTN